MTGLRAASLIASATEIVAALGAADLLVARTESRRASVPWRPERVQGNNS